MNKDPSRCPICGMETSPTADPYLDICINSEAHRPFFLRRKRPREEFPAEPELSQHVKDQLSKSCPRGSECDA